MEDAQLKSIIEALLFVSESPLSLERIKEILGEGSKKEIQRILGLLLEDYERNPRGFFMVEVAEGFQLRTRPEYAEWIISFSST